MSLYIPGLNLPRANQELWIAIQSDGSLRYNSCGWHDSQQKAIAVQSHGRLIDADAAIANRNKDTNWCYDLCDLPEYLSDCPTIIPTEEGE